MNKERAMVVMMVVLITLLCSCNGVMRGPVLFYSVDGYGVYTEDLFEKKDQRQAALAILRNDLSVIANLSNETVQARSKYYNVGLVWAAVELGRKEILRELLSKQAPVGGIDAKLFSVMELAAWKSSDTEVMAILLDYGANPDGYGFEDFPALKAAQAGHLEILKMLYHRGAKLARPYERGTTILRGSAGPSALRSGVSLWLIKVGVDPTTSNELTGITYLDIALGRLINADSEVAMREVLQELRDRGYKREELISRPPRMNGKLLDEYFPEESEDERSRSR